MTPRLARDIPKADALRALKQLGYLLDREQEHLALVKVNANGRQVMILPNHKRIKLSTLLTACHRAGIARQSLLDALKD
jgi:hypothetical protein